MDASSDDVFSDARLVKRESLSSMGGEEGSPTLESLAQALRSALGTRLVTVLLRSGTNFVLSAVAADSSNDSDTARAGHDRGGMQFASDLVAQSLSGGQLIEAATDASSQALGELAPPGVILAVPFRSAQVEGAALVYPRPDRAFTAEERNLVVAATNFAASNLSSRQQTTAATAHAHELHQLLDNASELNSSASLDQCLQRLALWAADFLGFNRVFVGLLEQDRFRTRWEADHGRTQALQLEIPEGPLAQALKSGNAFWLKENQPATPKDFGAISAFEGNQILAVPIINREGRVLGVLGALDRLDGADISRDDFRHAKILAAQGAVALEASLALHASEKQRQRAEVLVTFAAEMTSWQSLAEFGKGILESANKLLGAKAGALLLKQETAWEVIVLQALGHTDEPRHSQVRRFGHAVAEALSPTREPLTLSTAKELFGEELAASLGWRECALLRLFNPAGDLTGVLCLANYDEAWSEEQKEFLQTIASSLSIALEHARLFSRMEHANRHWMEIFDAISDFIVAHDSADNILRVNRSLADFIGVAPRELIGVNMCALLAMESAAPLRACPFCRSSGEGTDEYVHPVLGSTFLVSSSKVQGDNSDGMQTIHVLKDITDRREAERRYRELFGNIQEGLFFSTPQGSFIEVNDALVSMLGYANREELLQVDVRTQVFSSAEHYRRFAEPIETAGVVRSHEEALRRKDGATVYVLVNAFAVRDAKNNVTQFRGLMLDITDLKAYQAELQRERDFSGKILNNTQSLILVADTVGVVSYANRRWRDMGYEQKQVLGAQLESLVAPARRQVFKDAFGAILAGHQVDNLDLQILRGDGRVGQFSVNLSPMRDEQGNVTSIVVVMSDITDAATLQAKLMHAEKMAAVGQLVSGVAHEVNNPLTAILGFADLLMENEELPENARKDLRVILQEAQRTKQIVQNLLSFARQMPPQRRPVELNSILRRTLQLRAYDFQSHGVEVVEELDKELPDVIGDSQQLQQVFLNIVNNAYDAVKETGRPPRIEVRTTHRGGVVEVAFRDNGHGITFPDRIFDPFFTTKEVGKGTGLGLSICYGIVREHGGEILCHNNTGQGSGATFVVRFPAAPESASVGAAAGVTQR
jgi:two-component system NtrC family sensor kinase